MLILHGTAVVKPEARERWLAIVDKITPPSRAEKACLNYGVYEARDTPNTFVFVEEWESLEGLRAHFKAPHFTEFMGAVPQVLATPPTGSVFEASSGKTLDEVLAAATAAG